MDRPPYTADSDVPESTRQAAAARLQQAYASATEPGRRDWRDRLSDAGTTGVLVVGGLIALLVVGALVVGLGVIIWLGLGHNILAILFIALGLVISLGSGAQARTARTRRLNRIGGDGQRGVLSMTAGLELEAAEAERIKHEQNN
jgi:hypothetical protein